MKKKIVIASVLKPINDARMYEKFGISLANTGNYEVHIIGFPSSVPSHPNITFHPTQNVSRLSLTRYLLPLKIYKIIAEVKPEVLIVNTHELLLVAVACKIKFGTKILYDVQENYFRNLWYQDNYLPGVKQILAINVRAKEYLVSPFLDHRLLSEVKYTKEMPFLKKNSTVILNKYKSISNNEHKSKRENGGKLTFLYSGTIAIEYGIMDAIKFQEKLRQISLTTLIIKGHCPNNKLFKFLSSTYKDTPDIRLEISSTPIDHEEIEHAYLESDFALMPYKSNKSTENCIPVKFYECIAFRLPIILPDHNPYWTAFLSDYQAYYPINFNNFNPKKLVSELQSQKFYEISNIDKIYWSSEEAKLLSVLAKI